VRIAVLGASSFSGTAFTAEAWDAGHDVLELSRSAGHDLSQESGIDKIVQDVVGFRPHCFVNYAALNVVADSWKHYPDYYRTNVIGVATLADRLSRLDFLERFVQVSTPEVYGNTNSPFGKQRPSNYYEPSTPYAVSRAAADMHLSAMHKSRGFPVSFTRTVNVYGPGQQTYRIIPKTVLKILRGEKLKLEGGGESERSFIHVTDMALGTLSVAQSGDSGRVYHFATDRMTKIRDLVSMICGMIGVKFEDAVEVVEDRPGKDRMYLLDWLDSNVLLGWKPTVELEEGLEQTVSWFRGRSKDYAGQSLEYVHA
jgi:dTDP-glucose 4,6-dehydratase